MGRENKEHTKTQTGPKQDLYIGPTGGLTRTGSEEYSVCLIYANNSFASCLEIRGSQKGQLLGQGWQGGVKTCFGGQV